ncbi:hypothetical protein [Kutzneria chonburiensis]|uniref:Uncharacterized protein n=1 Tax=Kutzneria chonburiensis TaxID=1483604 RepID=A0ABV6N4D1_9PSEU|nr:hypothetical protein [Kutzneria chonburiensis]
MALGTSGLLIRAAGITLAFGMITAGLATPALADTGAPTNPTVDRHSCGTQPILVNALDTASQLAVTPGDSQATTEFDWWPVDQPDQRASAQTSDSAVLVQHSALSDGVTYAWQARSGDGPWSDICEFTTDFVAPGKPTVTSPDYPPGGGGGVGKPGRFILSANGSADTVGFRYGASIPATYVAADKTGGSATIWITPNSWGTQQLVVTSVDAAGNVSGVTKYLYTVNNNKAQVSCTPGSGYIGVARQCTFTPTLNRYTGYTYEIGNGTPVSVDADDNGSATVTVTPMSPSDWDITVQGRMFNGNLGDPVSTGLGLDSGVPWVQAATDEAPQGSTVQFTLHSVLPGSTSFVYTWGGADPVTVAVGDDGTATVDLTVDRPGFEQLDVYTTTAAGATSGHGFGSVTVD